ncbi:MAG: hypothetical protein A2174_02365 [Candidatus Portnoybacteria bacterium RBG_13_41_18]|uniref:Uncharacterized protein n=1 Tax=Candidatus Portnoybacteria bacterium RBG_13_41_18 TaxID=1801991 RepID=A0A1G2F9L5_9BACT|nr:MAG: hypothetical protein A2174_02365 [Candidatus Portnoybacteria bacterium RBG_13_41_18]
MAFAPLLFIVYINIAVFFLQGIPRFLVPVFPLYLLLAVFGLWTLVVNGRIQLFWVEKLIKQ